jgi:ATP-dependent Zn protease
VIVAMEAAEYLRAMSYHEAGHAVVAWSLGLQVGDIHVREIGAGNGGAQIGTADYLPLIHQLAALAAGDEAEKAFGCQLPDHASDRDREMSISVVLKYHPALPSDEIQWRIDAGHRRAHQLVLDHRDSVERLADRLRRDHRVSAVTFESIMKLPDR